MHGVEARYHGGGVEVKRYRVFVCYDKRVRWGLVDHQIGRLDGHGVNWLTHFDNEISGRKDNKPTDWAGYRATFSRYWW